MLIPDDDGGKFAANRYEAVTVNRKYGLCAAFTRGGSFEQMLGFWCWINNEQRTSQTFPDHSQPSLSKLLQFLVISSGSRYLKIARAMCKYSFSPLVILGVGKGSGRWYF